VRRTFFSSRFFGSYNVQHTRLRSEQTLNRSPASGWKHANTPFSRIDIRKSTISSASIVGMHHTFQYDPDDPLLFNGCTLLIDLPEYRHVFPLFQSTGSKLIKEGVDSFKRELAFFDGRAGCDFVIEYSCKVTRMGFGLQISYTSFRYWIDSPAPGRVVST
jgi:hypothetical protein